MPSVGFLPNDLLEMFFLDFSLKKKKNETQFALTGS
jgi:hypothetical protein